MASLARVNLGSNKFSPSRTAQNGANMVNEPVKSRDSLRCDATSRRSSLAAGADLVSVHCDAASAFDLTPGQNSTYRIALRVRAALRAYLKTGANGSTQARCKFQSIEAVFAHQYVLCDAAQRCANP
ncbi:hypothetical protein BM221_006262 [Beauveria bassiana]|uniref:Uncharacterized protein n=1 Tax=Beauveria bassiana TaxID=176275 RepID=A0A2N6NLC9_BEABA|nr:hypothetical protein BM221_006262 [Beauveria bassiana]